MLHNIAPNRKRSSSGSLTEEEKPLVKRLLKMGYKAQDIVHILNQGRCTTVNSARVTEIAQNYKIEPVSEEAAKEFIKIQSAYDPITLLNPYKHPRLVKAREAMITAIQLFNTPTLLSRGELFCIHANIGWTYLLHEKMERELQGSSSLENGNKVTLAGTLDKPDKCPIKDVVVIENLKKITKIRNEAEHGLSPEIPDLFHPAFQSCCINFENIMTEWFGKRLSLAQNISLALQFSRLDHKQIVSLENSSLPPKLRTIYGNMQESEYANDQRFQATVHYSEYLGSKSQADMYKFTSNIESCNLVAKQKIKVDPREEFPLSYTSLFDECKKIIPEIKKNKQFNEIISRIIKPKQEYAMVDLNPSQRSVFKNTNRLPQNPTYIYKNQAVNVIIEEYKKRGYP